MSNWYAIYSVPLSNGGVKRMSNKGPEDKENISPEELLKKLQEQTKKRKEEEATFREGIDILEASEEEEKAAAAIKQQKKSELEAAMDAQLDAVLEDPEVKKLQEQRAKAREDEKRAIEEKRAKQKKVLEEQKQNFVPTEAMVAATAAKAKAKEERLKSLQAKVEQAKVEDEKQKVQPQTAQPAATTTPSTIAPSTVAQKDLHNIDPGTVEYNIGFLGLEGKGARVYRELLESEKSYLKAMNAQSKQEMQAMVNIYDTLPPDELAGFTSKEQLQVIFAKFVELREAQEELMVHLQNRDPMQWKVGLESLMQHYKNYFEAQHGMNIPPKIYNYKLGSMLITPIQRFPRYGMLMAELKKELEKSKPGSTTFDEVTEDVINLTKALNKTIGEKDEAAEKVKNDKMVDEFNKSNDPQKLIPIFTGVENSVLKANELMVSFDKIDFKYVTPATVKLITDSLKTQRERWAVPSTAEQGEGVKAEKAEKLQRIQEVTEYLSTKLKGLTVSNQENTLAQYIASSDRTPEQIKAQARAINYVMTPEQILGEIAKNMDQYKAIKVDELKKQALANIVTFITELVKADPFNQQYADLNAYVLETDEAKKQELEKNPLIQHYNQIIQKSDNVIDSQFLTQALSGELERIAKSTLDYDKLQDKVAQILNAPPNTGKFEFDVNKAAEVAADLKNKHLSMLIKIKPSELPGCPWLKTETQDKCPSIKAFIDDYNNIQSTVSNDIVLAPYEAEQKNRFAFYVHLLDETMKAHDYHSGYAILNALDGASVNRLKNLKGDPVLDSILDKHRKTLSSANNYKDLKIEIKANLGEPHILPMNVFTRELFAIEDANPAVTEDGKPNMLRVEMLGQSNLALQNAQDKARIVIQRTSTSKLNAKTTFGTRFSDYHLTEQEQYDRSLEVYPRGDDVVAFASKNIRSTAEVVAQSRIEAKVKEYKSIVEKATLTSADKVRLNLLRREISDIEIKSPRIQVFVDKALQELQKLQTVTPVVVPPAAVTPAAVTPAAVIPAAVTPAVEPPAAVPPAAVPPAAVPRAVAPAVPQPPVTTKPHAPAAPEDTKVEAPKAEEQVGIFRRMLNTFANTIKGAVSKKPEAAVQAPTPSPVVEIPADVRKATAMGFLNRVPKDAPRYLANQDVKYINDLLNGLKAYTNNSDPEIKAEAIKRFNEIYPQAKAKFGNNLSVEPLVKEQPAPLAAEAAAPTTTTTQTVAPAVTPPVTQTTAVSEVKDEALPSIDEVWALIQEQEAAVAANNDKDQPHSDLNPLHIAPPIILHNITKAPAHSATANPLLVTSATAKPSNSDLNVAYQEFKKALEPLKQELINQFNNQVDNNLMKEKVEKTFKYVIDNLDPNKGENLNSATLNRLKGEISPVLKKPPLTGESVWPKIDQEFQKLDKVLNSPKMAEDEKAHVHPKA